jgi:hypothetical protein
MLSLFLQNVAITIIDASGSVPGTLHLDRSTNVQRMAQALNGSSRMANLQEWCHLQPKILHSYLHGYLVQCRWQQ